MSVYVDNYRAPFRSQRGFILRMSHMLADTPEELHSMAERIGVARRWFQGDHYDVCEAKRLAAIKLGAVACQPRDLVAIRRAWRAAGWDRP